MEHRAGRIAANPAFCIKWSAVHSQEHPTMGRQKPNHAYIKAIIDLYRRMQEAKSEAEFQELLAEHDRFTDAEKHPRMRHRTLVEFQRGSAI